MSRVKTGEGRNHLQTGALVVEEDAQICVPRKILLTSTPPTIVSLRWWSLLSVQLVQVCGRVCRDEGSLSSTICHIDDRKGAQGNLPVISASGTVMPGSNKSPMREWVASSDGKHADAVFDSHA